MTPLRVLLVLPVVLSATVVVALVWPSHPRDPAPVVAPVPVASAVTPDPAVEALRSWDARRAAAWASGDVAALRRLYVAGSRTGRQDAALLRAYADRGVRVTGLQVQLLAVDVLVRSDHRLVLVVTDRLARVVARRAGARLRLPEDRPSTYRIVLRRVAGEWRVVEVRSR